MATAWNLKKVYEILNTKIKTDVNEIYNSLVQIDRSVDALMAVDQAATTKNGTTVANFSGHKAMAFFYIMKNEAEGYYAHSEQFYEQSYNLCKLVTVRAQERAVKDNNAKYKSYPKWSGTLPAKKRYSFNHVISAGVTEDIANVSANIYALRDQVDVGYNAYIRAAQKFSKDIKELRKYTPDEVDRKIYSLIKNIDSRITATGKRREQLTSYINEVTCNYLLANRDDESAMASASANFASNGPATKTIDNG